MNLGRVYTWCPDPAHPLHGRVCKEDVPLPNLDCEGEGKGRLWGKFVRVRNAGWVNEPDASNGAVRRALLGDAQPDVNGDFVYDPGRGGSRVDLVEVHPFRSRYVRAAHFGEVNTYYHIDRIATYIQSLLAEIGVQPLPRVLAVVNAHQDALVRGEDCKNGHGQVRVPFQGGHYRLASNKFGIPEKEAVFPTGEIHLGPGRQLWRHGALAERSGKGYRANAAHNAGIIYHEYGHHITRHTADFHANAFRRPERQNNRKTALDEGTCDYWTAVMLESPHIWSWHHRHDETVIHPRSLASKKTIADFDPSPKADPHLSGTIWGASLWDLRANAMRLDPNGGRRIDCLVMQALLLIGRKTGFLTPPTVKSIREARKGFVTGLRALIEADEILYSGNTGDLILTTFAKRGIFAEANDLSTAAASAEPVWPAIGPSRAELMGSCPEMPRLLQHVRLDDIPETADLHSGGSLEAVLSALDERPVSLVAMGDIMLGGRARKPIAEFGADYPFEALRPLLRRASIGLGNLEGPLAGKAEKLERRYSYRVAPRTARILLRAGVNVVTLANNHLLDCGREGVLKTLQALSAAGVVAIGAGVNRQAAHAPGILQAGPYRVGLLGYYWNRRTAARAKLPGSAMDSEEELAADIGSLRKQVDRVVATFHWGVPYLREPSAEDRAKARFALDCGADVVIGHHPHIIQPFEVYRGKPIFYSVGNLAFGSGNTRGESLLVAVRFEGDRTMLQVYPVYVKNRDPRLNYQPKILRGEGAKRILEMLRDISGESGALMSIAHDRGNLELPRAAPHYHHD